MMESFRQWWSGRTAREHVLLIIMGVLVALVILWLCVYRPVESALRQSALDNMDAAQRYGSVLRKVELIKQAGSAASASSLPVEQIVGQSAGEAGFTLDRVQAQGNDRVELAIASARSTALMAWIVSLEAQGVVVEKAMISPSGGTGTVSAQITYKRAGS
ncbi:MAG: type II secretion system protein GspM [Sphingobium sp.]|nr:type II secretion system protein M [Sphingobium sp.]MCP5400200.1 type II secretion system protein M [Sphingomonas sp.]